MTSAKEGQPRSNELEEWQDLQLKNKYDTKYPEIKKEWKNKNESYTSIECCLCDLNSAGVLTLYWKNQMLRQGFPNENFSVKI